MKVIPDADTRFSALKAGEILGVIDLSAIPASLAVELEGDENFAITTTKSTMIRFLTLNGTKFPFDDVRMRQAVSLCRSAPETLLILLWRSRNSLALLVLGILRLSFKF